jgi:actin related protein 2/3 complex subunit 1A/1B
MLTKTLKEHQDHVTGLSWSSNNRIVSCSSDRNAYVWTYEGAEWKPTLVLLRIPKGARCVAWNAQENKFVVGSVGVVAVCWFDEENNWWVSKHIKVKGTVLSINWHMGGIIFACGSTDGKAVISCKIFDMIC